MRLSLNVFGDDTHPVVHDLEKSAAHAETPRRSGVPHRQRSLPEQAFYMVGGIDEAVEKVKKLASA